MALVSYIHEALGKLDILEGVNLKELDLEELTDLAAEALALAMRSKAFVEKVIAEGYR